MTIVTRNEREIVINKPQTLQRPLSLLPRLHQPHRLLPLPPKPIMHLIMIPLQTPANIPREMLPATNDARLRQHQTQLPVPLLDHVPRDGDPPAPRDRCVPDRVDGHVGRRLY